MARVETVKRVYYTPGEPDDDEPTDIDADYGDTVKEAESAIAEMRLQAERDKDDPEYFDRLKLFRITIEEVPRAR